MIYTPNMAKYQMRWTVITGATDGIGRAYTLELARRGIRKFLLIGRNEAKLEAVKSQLESQYDNCFVRTLLFDFFSDDYSYLREELKDVDIGLAVNSVGVGREFLERYGDNPDADHQLLRVNGLGAAEFLSCILPPMEQNGGGQIVVLSSTQGIRPIPLLAAYSATKALMCFLSEAIDREYSSISVQCLTPALVATKMTYYESGSLFVVSPENFARQAVSVLGMVKSTSGCFNHEIQMLAMHLFPWSILKYLLMPIYWKQQKRVIELHAKSGKAPLSNATPPKERECREPGELENYQETENGAEETTDTSTECINITSSQSSPQTTLRKVSKIPTSNGVIRNRA
ncbi:short chain dehydrogenase domain-containing protein [Ditylenchus destructor]|uniref:Short chain dehydrogenase domain-containing protein n=1 Tax=Ditylenchus destructor TaxID=166010 RepID=A0AAD4R4E8_9BILA|nr:short chain dehydrogenase domain-containing protein [Ditylenchus destructor]